MEILSERTDSEILQEIREMFYGQGLEVTGWHLNGATEPLDNFFEDNGWV